PGAVVLLLECDQWRQRQHRRQHAADQQGVFPAVGDSVGRGPGQPGRSEHRSAARAGAAGLLRRRLRLAATRLAVPGGTHRPHGAGRERLALGPGRPVSRCALRRALPRPGLAVRHAGDLLDRRRPRALAPAFGPEPDDRRDRSLSLGATRHRRPAAVSTSRLNPDRHVPSRNRPALLPPHGAHLRRRDLSCRGLYRPDDKPTVLGPGKKTLLGSTTPRHFEPTNSPLSPGSQLRHNWTCRNVTLIAPADSGLGYGTDPNGEKRFARARRDRTRRSTRRAVGRW